MTGTYLQKQTSQLLEGNNNHKKDVNNKIHNIGDIYERRIRDDGGETL